jgi:chromosome segregation ATPase
MPEINAIHITIIAALSIVGAIVGWALCSKRAVKEKAVINASWQEQINSQRTEHDRLIEQNKSLMDKNSQYLTSNSNVESRSKKLAEAAQEANQRRDQLQLELEELRNTVEVSQSERDQLQSVIRSRAAEARDAEAKDERIQQLRLSLESWQGRLPPLIEKFQKKNEEVSQLDAELAEARERIRELELLQKPDQTIVEEVHSPEELTRGRVASNDPDDNVESDSVTRISKDLSYEELVPPDDVLEPDSVTRISKDLALEELVSP